jgi:hypothetical protein
MSLLIDIVKKAQGKSIDKVTVDLYNTRISVCNGCPYLVGKTRSCGKLMVGGEVEYNGEKMELCGCKIDDKAKYRSDKCPLGKW